MSPLLAVTASIGARTPLDVPITLGRDEAARLARLELARPEYSGDERPLVQRVLTWLVERIGELLDRTASTSPAGWFGVLGILALIVVAVVLVRRRTGRLRRASTGTPLFDAADRTADAYRRDAERFAGAGAWAEAVRARLRAVVRDLEERDIVDARPGRTADEIARDGGRALPTVAAELRRGTRAFDDVWYGGRTADATTYATLVAVDDAVGRARPDEPAARAGHDLAVPR